MDNLTRRYVHYLAGLPADIDRILVEGDTQDLARAAHLVAGTAGSFGFPEVSDASLALEAAAKRGTRTKRLKGELQTTITVFKIAVAEAVASKPGPPQISPILLD
jgi:HPt (histidine-containing phosphotransfer) domain-containing protein